MDRFRNDDMYAAAQRSFPAVAQNHDMSAGNPPSTESAKKGSDCEEADRKAIERAENEGLAEPPKQENARPVPCSTGLRGEQRGPEPHRSEN